MESYRVGGTTDLSKWDFEELPGGWEWIVYEYSYDCYRGEGYAVCKCGDNLLIYCLSHCSCYGPLGEPSQSKVLVKDWFSHDIHATPDLSRAIIEKINELLGARLS